MPPARPEPIPPKWRKHVSEILVSEARLASRARSLARAIEKDFRGRDFVIVPLLTGTVMFMADLLRCVSIPCRVDFMGVSTYREGTTSGEIVFTKELRLDVQGRDVLVVDDILDTGKTLARVTTRLKELGARRIKICVLLEKKARRTHNVRADYVGFSIPDKFVVGYGLDYAERYRNLPFVGVLKRELY